MGQKIRFFSGYARLLTMLLALCAAFAHPTMAADPDLPLAAASPMAGIDFDDKPLFLPVQKNFQMAMLTASNELGRSCGKMEAYGWRMNQNEQARVDRIFNATVDRFRGLGYEVKTEAPGSVSRDITMFTADRDDKHFLSMWSAGEIGLVMVLCETGSSHNAHLTVPSSAEAVPVKPAKPSVEIFTPPPAPITADTYDKFTPVGEWVGNYVCGQGYTGGALTITKLQNGNFEGDFHFYPTAKNPSVPEGRYTVYGQYDRASQRILINPGRWLKRPPDYYNTILVGSFDPATKTLSAYFQGINGCTSFEARQKEAPVKMMEKPALKHHKHAAPAKPKAKKPAATSALVPMTVAPPAESKTAVAPAPAAAPSDSSGLVTVTLPTPSPAPAQGEKPALEVGAPTGNAVTAPAGK